MSQPRFELYINVHKGLRYLFGQILYQAGRIDYGSDTDLDKFAVQLDELTTYLKDHADNEEECVLKPLKQRAPDAIKRDLEVHGRLVEEEKKFVALFSEVRQQRDKDRVSMPGWLSIGASRITSRSTCPICSQRRRTRWTRCGSISTTKSSSECFKAS